MKYSDKIQMVKVQIQSDQPDEWFNIQVLTHIIPTEV